MNRGVKEFGADEYGVFPGPTEKSFRERFDL